MDTPISLTTDLQAPQKLPFVFTGKADEYFKIWIVNTVLTIFTLGIYSPWAKVRARRYIYGHSFLVDRNFDYHADPIAILKGRLIMGALAVMLYGGGYISIFIPFIAGFLLFAITPWILVKSLRFNLKNTSYRNLRFNFEENYSGSYYLYIVGGVLNMITLGLYFPIFMLRHHGFVLNHASYGDTRLRMSEQAGFYGIYLRAAGLQILGSLVIAIFVAMIAGAAALLIPSLSSVIGIVTPLVTYAVFAFTGAYIRAHTINYLSQNTTLGDLRFGANLEFMELAKIYVTNFFAIVLTLGLATPWALIRARKYRMENMFVLTPSLETLEQFSVGDRSEESAAGDAAADFFDFDVGF